VRRISREINGTAINTMSWVSGQPAVCVEAS